MVEIREESSGGDNGNNDTSPPPVDPGPVPIMDYLKSRPIDAVLWAMRIITLAFGFLYAFPIIGGAQEQSSYFTKTLLAGGATNALRLHQRLGGFRLSREFMAEMFLEDSCHYLFYCVMFISLYPVTMAIMPVFLFAFLHWSSFTIHMLNAAGMQGGMVHRMLTNVVTNYSHNLLMVIACTEIFIMPMLVAMIFMGRSNLLLPFIYYRFLSLRYMSRRNPNTRVAFSQMKYALEMSVNRPGCPPFLANIAHKVIALVSRLAPQTSA